MRKILFILFAVISLFGFSYSSDFPYQVWNEESVKNVVWTEKMWPFEQKDVMDDITKAYLWDDDIKGHSSPFVYYVSKVINYFLAILAFIAVVILLYGFSLVFTDKTDEWIKKWMKYVKMASIAIIVIWVSWLFSMWIFYIYNRP